ncbi:hypothetical protein [Stappia sp.]|uniref:MotE family protein n=1 Tax=Stappia sp. TaxID=1870903 RepID=UPI0032D9A0C3
MTSLRLIPVLLLAASALLGLKLADLLLAGDGVTGGGVSVAMAQTADETAGANAGEDAPAQDGDAAADGAAEAPLPDGGLAGGDATGEGLPAGLELGGSIAERKVLESLSDRRQELDQRERQFELREQILKSTEDRLKKKVEEIRALEASITEQREAEKAKRDGDLRNLVMMYESMKAKDAARIFDRLDLDILLEVAKAMKPRKMADIMGRMSPEASERLTVALVRGREAALDPQAGDATGVDALPKIMGN